MKSLIRFEDTYGLADIFCCMSGFPYLDRTQGNPIVELTNEIFVQNALSNIGCFVFDENVEFFVKERGIDRIIIVFDLDAPSGDKRKILSVTEAQQKLAACDNFFKGSGYSVDVVGVPVAYAAETIMLYQYLGKKSLDLEIESLVHKNDTNHFHLLLLTALCDCKDYRKAKRVRDFIDKKLMVHKIQKNIESNDKNINKGLLEWICHECSMNRLTFDRQATLISLQSANRLFYDKIDVKKAFTLAGKNGTIDLDTDVSLGELEKLVKVGM